MIEASRLLGVVDLLYEAALSGDWTTPLRAAASLFETDNGVLAVHDMRSMKPLAAAWVGVEKEYQLVYPELYMQPEMGAIAQNVLADARSFDVLTEDFQTAYPSTFRTRFHNEFLRPQRMDRQILGQGPPWAAGWAVLFLALPSSAQAFDADAVAAMRILQPHLLRAVQIRQRLDGVELEREQARDALDRMEQGILLVDGEGRVGHANKAAEALLGRGDGLATANGSLRCHRAEDSRALHRLIAAATRGKLAPPQAPLAVRRPSGHPLAVLVAPLRHDDPWQNGSPASAIVFVSDPDKARSNGAAELARRYGLTPAEAGAARRRRSFGRGRTTLGPAVDRAHAHPASLRQDRDAPPTGTGPADHCARAAGRRRRLTAVDYAKVNST